MPNGDDVSKQMLEMPALRRHFDLGTAYDAINEKIITGFTFWNESDSKNVNTIRPAYYTEFSNTASDKLADKFQELKINGSLQVSILCGMIELGGSANHLNKKKSTSRESSVHVTLKRHTAVKELNMDQLDEINKRYPQIQRSGRMGSATHIVTEIEYGAEATFTFTKKLIKTENEQEVNGKLKLGAEKITKILEGVANVESGWTDTNLETEDNIECHFQGNLCNIPSTTVNIPTTYKEAIEFAKNLLQCSSDWMAKDPSDANKSLGVPITVRLYPLVLMKNAQGAPALRYVISDKIASECVGIMENYGFHRSRADELVLKLEDPLENLSPLKNKLQNFQGYLTSFLADKLKKKLGEMVVDIRSGKIKEKDFEREMNGIKNEPFPFNSKHLDQWLDQKNDELNFIKRRQVEVEKKSGNRSLKVHFFPSATTLQEEMTKFPVDFGYEFSFSYLSRPEPFLNELNQSSETNCFKVISSTITEDLKKFWCKDESITKRIQKEIDFFVKFVNVKSNDKKFAFAMTSPDEYNEICAKEFSIIVHHEQKEIFGWDAVLNVFQQYPKGKMIDVIRLLVEEEIDETWNAIPFLALCRYYKKDNLIDIVRLLIKNNIDVVKCETSDGWDAILLLCRYYNNENLFKIIELLIKNHLKVKNESLLLLCQYYDKENLFEIIEKLIEKNIDVNCKDNNGWNALHLVCRYYVKENLIDIVRLLIEKNIDVNNCKTYKEEHGYNALLLLCQFYDKENLFKIIELLIQKNIDVNCKTNNKDNALTLLCQFYKRENLFNIIELLIQKNIDVKCQTKEGWNALLLLCQFYDKKNLFKIIELLIEANIDVNCETNDGWTALHFVCRYYKNENLIEIIKLLIGKNIKVNSKTNDGRNALHLVCRNYDKENLIDIVEFLIEKNIDVNCKNNDGWNALHFVCRYELKSRLVALVSILVRHKIDQKVETTGDEIGTARSFLLNRKKEEIEDVLQMLDS